MPVHHHRAADAGSEREQHERVRAAPVPAPRLPERAEVGVVVDFERPGESPAEHAKQIQVLPVHVRARRGQAGVRVDQGRDADDRRAHWHSQLRRPRVQHGDALEQGADRGVALAGGPEVFRDDAPRQVRERAMAAGSAQVNGDDAARGPDEPQNRRRPAAYRSRPGLLGDKPGREKPLDDAADRGGRQPEIGAELAPRSLPPRPDGVQH
jgi:hypothetical protein